jgi:glycosyltransferase involved in cell wall biosynthesis
VFNSALAKRLFNEMGAAQPSRSSIIYNLPPSSVSTGIVAPREENQSDSFRWLAVGRAVPAKDYETLLWAFADLTRSNHNVTLSIAGGGPLQATLERLARDLSIDHRCTFLGHVKNPEPLYRSHDAFVLSSVWEGMPNALIEAAFAGLPIVATRVGAVPELLGGHSAFTQVVPPQNAVALAYAMREITNASPTARSQMAETLRLRVRELTDPRTIVEQWSTLLESAGKNDE